jgi:hypothetical protein
LLFIFTSIFALLCFALLTKQTLLSIFLLCPKYSLHFILFRFISFHLFSFLPTFPLYLINTNIRIIFTQVTRLNYHSNGLAWHSKASPASTSLHDESHHHNNFFTLSASSHPWWCMWNQSHLVCWGMEWIWCSQKGKARQSKLSICYIAFGL